MSDKTAQAMHEFYVKNARKRLTEDSYVLNDKKRSDYACDALEFIEKSGSNMIPLAGLADCVGLQPDWRGCIPRMKVLDFIETFTPEYAWNKARAGDGPDINFHCSVCHYKTKADITSWQFCPHCGSCWAPYYIYD